MQKQRAASTSSASSAGGATSATGSTESAAISVQEGCFIFESPNRPILKTNYLCDKVFHVDYLVKLLAPQQYYGGILLSQKESRFYLVNDVETKLLEVVRQVVPKKQKKGGQSAARIGRAREGKRDRNNDYLARRVLHHYWDSELQDCAVLGLLIGGPAETKQAVMADAEFQKYLARRVILVENLSEIQEGSLELLFKKSQSGGHLNDDLVNQEKLVLTEIQSFQQTDDELLAYGLAEIQRGLVDCTFKKIILTNSSPHFRVVQQLLEKADYQPELVLVQSSEVGEELDRDYQGLLAIKWF